MIRRSEGYLTDGNVTNENLILEAIMTIEIPLMTRLDNTSYSVRDLTLALHHSPQFTHFAEIKLQQHQASLAMLQRTNTACAYTIKNALLLLIPFDIA